MALALAAALPARAEAVKIGMPRLISYGAVPIAIDKGYFAREGLEVEIVFFDSAQPVAIAGVTGAIDFGIAGPTAGFFSLAGHGALRIIGGVNREVPGFHSLAYLASRRAYDAGLRSFTDLPGHAVAITQVGTPLHYSLSLLAERYGFPLARVRVLPLQSNTNVTAALTGGQADAAVFPVTPATQLLERGEVKLLGWVSDQKPPLPGSVLFTSTRFADEHADVVQRLLRAYRAGARDYNEAFVGPGETRRDGPTAPTLLPILARFAELTVDQVRLGIAFVDPEARLDEAGILREIAWYKAQGMLKPDTDASAIIDRRYVVPLDPS